MGSALNMILFIVEVGRVVSLSYDTMRVSYPIFMSKMTQLCVFKIINRM